MRSLPMDAVLLSAADELACEEQQRALAAVDQYQLVDEAPAVALWKVHGRPSRPRTMLSEPLLTDGHVAGGETFLKSQEGTGVLAVGADERGRRRCSRR